MAHYRILVIGVVDFTAGCAAWNAYMNLKAAGHAVELMDPRRYTGLLDSGGEPDEAVLGPLLRTFRPDYVACRGEGATEILDALAQVEPHPGPAPRRFVVLGYVGPDNFGDEFLFKTICEHLRGRYPGCHVSLIGYSPDKTLARHGVASVRIADKAFVNTLLNGASALVLMGGIIFDDPVLKSTCGMADLFLNPAMQIPGQTAVLELAYMNHVPAVFLGVGAGPLSNPDAQRLVKLGSLTRPRYVLRDQASVELLSAAGVDPALLSLKADLAWSARYPGPTGVQGPGYVVVSLRDWDTMSERLEGDVAQTLDGLCRDEGLRVVFLAFDPSDASVHERVAGRMACRDQAELRGSDDFDATTSTIADASFVLAMRLHCSIIAAAQGVPAVGLDYNVKVGQVYGQLGLGRLCLPMDADAERLSEACLTALRERDALTQAMRPAVEANRALAEEAFEELYEVVDASSPQPTRQIAYPRSVSREHAQLLSTRKKLAAERKRVRELAADNERLEAELEAARAERPAPRRRLFGK